ncbi:Transposase/invertase (TIGR01784 family) [Spirobacillus cienkowskii]
MQDRLFEQAKETLYFLSHHPEERAAYTQRLKYLLDTASRIDDAKAKGEARGIQIGEARGEHRKAIETAKKLKARDFSMIDIIDMTGLSPEEVENL